MQRMVFVALLGALWACNSAGSGADNGNPGPSTTPTKSEAPAAKSLSKTKYTKSAKRQQALDAGASSALFAGGCFWGVEHYFEKEKGVLAVTSGYAGGRGDKPTYKEVSSGTTGHAEVVEVLYDSKTINYETLARLFFEIHDPTQKDGQGPDIGTQYRSAVYVKDAAERKTVNKLIGLLRAKGFNVVTEVADATPFWPAEDYHQDYYARTGGEPYCHARVKRF